MYISSTIKGQISYCLIHDETVYDTLNSMTSQKPACLLLKDGHRQPMPFMLRRVTQARVGLATAPGTSLSQGSILVVLNDPFDQNSRRLCTISQHTLFAAWPATTVRKRSSSPYHSTTCTKAYTPKK
jgi:hypothetical protein